MRDAAARLAALIRSTAAGPGPDAGPEPVHDIDSNDSAGGPADQEVE